LGMGGGGMGMGGGGMGMGGGGMGMGGGGMFGDNGAAAAAQREREEEQRRAAHAAAQKKREEEQRKAAEMAAQRKRQQEQERAAAAAAAQREREEEQRRAAEVAAQRKRQQEQEQERAAAAAAAAQREREEEQRRAAEAAAQQAAAAAAKTTPTTTSGAVWTDTNKGDTQVSSEQQLQQQPQQRHAGVLQQKQQQQQQPVAAEVIPTIPVTVHASPVLVPQQQFQVSAQPMSSGETKVSSTANVSSTSSEWNCYIVSSKKITDRSKIKSKFGIQRLRYKILTENIKDPWTYRKNEVHKLYLNPSKISTEVYRYFSDFKTIHNHMSNIGAQNLPAMPDEGGAKNFMKSRREKDLDARMASFNKLLQYMATNEQMKNDIVVQEFFGVRLKTGPDVVGRFTIQKDNIKSPTVLVKDFTKSVTKSFKNKFG
jgi:hypothetical protein